MQLQHSITLQSALVSSLVQSTCYSYLKINVYSMVVEITNPLSNVTTMTQYINNILNVSNKLASNISRLLRLLSNVIVVIYWLTVFTSIVPLTQPYEKCIDFSVYGGTTNVWSPYLNIFNSTAALVNATYYGPTTKSDSNIRVAIQCTLFIIYTMMWDYY